MASRLDSHHSSHTFDAQRAFACVDNDNPRNPSNYQESSSHYPQPGQDYQPHYRREDKSSASSVRSHPYNIKPPSTRHVVHRICHPSSLKSFSTASRRIFPRVQPQYSTSREQSSPPHNSVNPSSCLLLSCSPAKMGLCWSKSQPPGATEPQETKTSDPPKSPNSNKGRQLQRRRGFRYWVFEEGNPDTITFTINREDETVSLGSFNGHPGIATATNNTVNYNYTGHISCDGTVIPAYSGEILSFEDDISTIPADNVLKTVIHGFMEEGYTLPSGSIANTAGITSKPAKKATPVSAIATMRVELTSFSFLFR